MKTPIMLTVTFFLGLNSVSFGTEPKPKPDYAPLVREMDRQAHGSFSSKNDGSLGSLNEQFHKATNDAYTAKQALEEARNKFYAPTVLSLIRGTPELSKEQKEKLREMEDNLFECRLQQANLYQQRQRKLWEKWAKEAQEAIHRTCPSGLARAIGVKPGKQCECFMDQLKHFNNLLADKNPEMPTAREISLTASLMGYWKTH